MLPRRRTPPPVRPPSLRASFKSTRDACSAGSNPNTTLESTEMVVANPRTRASIETWRTIAGSSSGANRGYSLVPTTASPMPQTPPASDNSRFSVTSCLMSRPRLAPAAVRRASSFRLPAPATSSRLATLAQPMSSTKRDRADEEGQHVLGSAQQRFANGLHAGPDIARLLAVRFDQLAADGCRFRRGRLGRHARFQAADGHHPPRVRDLAEVGRRPEGDVLQVRASARSRAA